MNLLIWCLFITTILPYLSRMPLLFYMKKQPGGYNNNNPRAQQATLTGTAARALAAHQNSFESLLVFAVAVLTALVTQHITETIQGLAVLHVVSRLIYHVAFLADWPGLRSSIWSVGFFSALFILGACL
ncbi:MAG: MAPEG family protein [Legionellaceae bacterium]|nr:MAPEG family protein [Legionellaceae bacterium]